MNKVKVELLRRRFHQDYLEPRGGDSEANRVSMAADAVAWSRGIGRTWPGEWESNPEYHALRSVGQLLDSPRGTWDAFIEYWNEFLDSVSHPGSSEERTPSSYLTDEQMQRIREVVTDALEKRTEAVVDEVLSALR